jgi:hypothetical protein
MSRMLGSFLPITATKQWTNHCSFAIGVPVPAKYREKNLITVWVEKVSHSTVF